MIKKFELEGLHGRLNTAADANPDINVLTGLNGCGKTTTLKVLWYLLSANIERIFQETSFSRIFVETDKLSIEIKRSGSESKRRYHFKHSIEELPEFTLSHDRAAEEDGQLRYLNRMAAKISGPTLFFPTFRRIEGGFSIKSEKKPQNPEWPNFGGRQIDTAMHDVSRRMSHFLHTFVCSLSTDDIASILTSKYAVVSERTNKLLNEVAERVMSAARELTPNETISAESFKDVVELTNLVDQEKKQLLRPFEVLSELVRSIFAYEGIVVDRSISLGESESAILSEHLSAGEKQMLSFLVYNAFFSGACIFIDEPELSLHVDWQRRLFPLLLEQGRGNQFFVATHSPFIYQKYMDKEILLAATRGE